MTQSKRLCISYFKIRHLLLYDVQMAICAAIDC